jgi:hypothetical protein
MYQSDYKFFAIRVIDWVKKSRTHLAVSVHPRGVGMHFANGSKKVVGPN